MQSRQESRKPPPKSRTSSQSVANPSLHPRTLPQREHIALFLANMNLQARRRHARTAFSAGRFPLPGNIASLFPPTAAQDPGKPCPACGALSLCLLPIGRDVMFADFVFVLVLVLVRCTDWTLLAVAARDIWNLWKSTAPEEPGRWVFFAAVGG